MKSFFIEGDRILLGFVSKDSIEGVIEFYKRNQDRIAIYNPPIPAEYLTLEFWEQKVRFRNSALKRERTVDFYMFLPDYPSRVVGHIRLFNIESSPRFSCEIGYTVDSLLEGHGIMHEAICLALSFARDGLALHRVVACCHPDNSKSLKLLAVLGFVHEGVSRESMLLNDVWQDMNVYSCIL